MCRPLLRHPTSVLGKEVLPGGTGDLAWRATITREEIPASGNSELIEITSKLQAHGWLGPLSHVVFYTLRHGAMYNIVLA
jgi:salicylate hydroxylase